MIQDFGPDATVPIEASQVLDLAALPYVDVFFFATNERSNL